MKIKQFIMTSLLSCIMAMIFVACSDDDGKKIPAPSPKEQWSATLKAMVKFSEHTPTCIAIIGNTPIT